MSNDNDNPQSVLEMELETLSSIFVDELDVKHDESGVSTVSILLHPATADKLDEQYVRMKLVFTLPEKYPEELPDISVENTRGLSDGKTEEITHNLLDIAESRVGSFMLFELIQSAKEQLTALNRPSEECAICLYGFVDGDVFMKTECYHYFHSHCLSRYVEYKLAIEEDEDKQNVQETVKDNNAQGKVPCPVCRLNVHFSEFGHEFPKPIAMVEAPITVDSQAWEGLNAFAHLYQKQLAQGGIIDVEAENNKFKLEISLVPDRAVESEKSAEKKDPQSAKFEATFKKGQSSVEGSSSAQSKSQNSPPKSPYMNPKQSEENVRRNRSSYDGDRHRTQFNRNSRYNDSKFKPHYYNPDKNYQDRYTKQGNVSPSKEAPESNETVHKNDSKNTMDKSQNDDYLSNRFPNSGKPQFTGGKNNSGMNRYDSRRNYDRPYNNRYNQNRSNYGPNNFRDNSYRRNQNINSSPRQEKSSNFPSAYRSRDKDATNSSAVQSKSYNHRKGDLDDSSRQNALREGGEHFPNEGKNEKKYRNYFREKTNRAAVPSENSANHKSETLNDGSNNPVESPETPEEVLGRNLKGCDQRDGENSEGNGEKLKGRDERQVENVREIVEHGEKSNRYDLKHGENSRGFDQRDGENSRFDQREGGKNARWYGQRNGEKSRGYDRKYGDNSRGFDQRNGENSKGFGQGFRGRGFDQRNDENSRRYYQRNGENPRKFEQRNNENSRGFDEKNGDTSRGFDDRNGETFRSFDHKYEKNYRAFEKEHVDYAKGFDKRHGEYFKGFDRTPRENYQFKDHSSKYQSQNNYHRNYIPGKFYNDSRSKRYNKESSPNQTAYENYPNSSYPDNRSRRYNRELEEPSKRNGAPVKYSNSHSRQLNAEFVEPNKSVPIPADTAKQLPELEKHRKTECSDQYSSFEDSSFQQKGEKVKPESKEAVVRQKSSDTSAASVFSKPPGLERQAKNDLLLANPFLSEDGTFQQQKDETLFRVENASKTKQLINSKAPLNSLSAAPLSLPPGFANPSKKVIYGLPSFHTPPGFNLS